MPKSFDAAWLRQEGLDNLLSRDLLLELQFTEIFDRTGFRWRKNDSVPTDGEVLVYFNHYEDGYVGTSIEAYSMHGSCKFGNPYIDMQVTVGDLLKIVELLKL